MTTYNIHLTGDAIRDIAHAILLAKGDFDAINRWPALAPVLQQFCETKELTTSQESAFEDILMKQICL